MSAFSSEPLNADESNELDYQHPDIRRIVGTTEPMYHRVANVAFLQKSRDKKSHLFRWLIVMKISWL